MSSVSISDRKSGIDRSVAEGLSSNRDLAMKLPPVDETFALQEVELSKSELQKLSEIGAIRRVERETRKTPSGNKYWRWRWETVSRAYEWVDRYFDDVPECPGEGCHSTGVRCLEAGQRYSCTNENCTETFGPKKAKELIHR